MNHQKELMRLAAVGSVDDGKSTLIGRLLYDSGSLTTDQIESVKAASASGRLDYSLFTDGLKREREEGITVDVAYRYFETARRKFIFADTPGHVEFTRHMVTGASTANMALILIDATKGIQEQTRRHTYISSLLQVPHLVLCVNKMDLVDFKEEVFEKIVQEFTKFSTKFAINDIHVIPVSAREGDNIVYRSDRMRWYDGPTLKYLLDHVHIASDWNYIDARMPVQAVMNGNVCKVAGSIVSGVLKPGDDVVVSPGGDEATIEAIAIGDKIVNKAVAPSSVTIDLSGGVKVSRGDMISRKGNQPKVANEFDAMTCWLSEEQLSVGKPYSIMHGTMKATATIDKVVYKVDVQTLKRDASDRVGLNDIARLTLKTDRPICFDPYRRNRSTGSFILIDPESRETAAAGMIV
ncbi:MAG: GTP-binding protein [bacterium]